MSPDTRPPRGLPAEARSWVAAACRREGRRLTGGTEVVRDQPWALTVRVETTEAPVWFKACGPGVRHEARLVCALAGLVPSLVPRVLDLDGDRGWFLAEHAGPTLRTAAAPDELWPLWEALLGSYAEAQLTLADHAAALLDTGLPVRSPASLPGQAAALVEQLSDQDPADGGLDAAAATGLRGRLAEYAGWCRDLAESGIPDSIQHDDLHTANLCRAGAAGPVRIIDWGDASFGCPLATMLCTLNSIGHYAGCDREDPRMLRVRDAYLEPFTRLADPAHLVHCVELARRAGAVTRALCYQTAYAGHPAASQADDDYPVREWLLELLAG